MKEIEKLLESTKSEMIDIINNLTYDNISEVGNTFNSLVDSVKSTMIAAIKVVVSKYGDSVILLNTEEYTDVTNSIIKPMRLHIENDTLYLEYRYTEVMSRGVSTNFYDDNLFVFNIDEINKIGKILDSNL